MKCFASHHLTPPESAVLDVCLRLTCGGTKPLHFDGRGLAAHFVGVSHQTVYRIAKRLEDKGWLHKTAGGFRSHAKDGQYAHKIYKVFSHEEWALKHKGKCRTVITGENGEPKSPSSQVRHGPSSPVDHSFCRKASVLPAKASEPSFLSGAGNQAQSAGIPSAVITSENGFPPGATPEQIAKWKELTQ